MLPVKGTDVIKCQLKGMTKDGAQKALGGQKVGGLDGFQLGRMGKDVSDVKAASGEAPDKLSAKAFTQGSDVFFKGSGKPDTQLMGHELAHVVQNK